MIFHSNTSSDELIQWLRDNAKGDPLDRALERAADTLKRRKP